MYTHITENDADEREREKERENCLQRLQCCGNEYGVLYRLNQQNKLMYDLYNMS